jgi:sec-independent protein translocase protein TatA
MMDLFAPTHLLILLAIILVLFGPSKLGDVGGTLGRSIRDFKKAMNEAENPNPPKPAAEAKPLEPKAEIFPSDCN